MLDKVKEKHIIKTLAKGEAMRIFLTVLILIFSTTVSAEIDLDRWADAILKAEGNPNYGIVSIKCDPTTDECRRYCKNTVYNTLVKYRSIRCKKGEDDLTCLARRYAPIGAENDPTNLNKNWKKNVKYFLERGNK